jgi:hypothetical protein
LQLLQKIALNGQKLTKLGLHLSLVAEGPKVCNGWKADKTETTPTDPKTVALGEAKMRKFSKGIACLVAMAFSVAAIAQLADPPRKRENARFVIVEQWKFVANGTARAEEIWERTYMPAMKEAGSPLPTILHPDTGEWDYMIIYPLAGGISDLEYTNISPSDAKWWAIVEKKVGSPAKALEMGKELQSLIARKETFLAHEHLDLVK